MTMKRQAARVATLVTVAVLSLLPLLRSTPALSLPVFFCKTCIQHATKLLLWFPNCLPLLRSTQALSLSVFAHL